MRRFALPFLLLLSLAATIYVYHRGLSGYFVFDDGPNIQRNSHLAIQDLKLDSLKQAAFSSDSGPLMRPISMLTLALNYYVSGFNPFYFKLTNLVIHLLNGVGIFILSALLLNFYRARFQPGLSIIHIQWVSLAVAAAWLLHTYNLTSVLYIVQRMTSLSAFFSIWGLVLFLWGRTRLYEGKGGVLPILWSLLLFMPLAALSKESGVLLPILMLVVEFTLFNFNAQKLNARRFIVGFFIVIAAVPAIAALAYTVVHPEWILAGYKGRSFTLAERLMTEARVLWVYIRQIILPNTAQMGLYHDDIVNSQGLFQPLSTIFSLVGILGLLGAAFLVRKKAPLITFGVLFFFAGHSLESTVFPLEIAHEHRNYLPMYGLLLILFFYLLYPLNYAKNLRIRQTVAILLIGLFAFNTFSRASQWSNPFDLAQSEVMHHPNSVRANNEMADIYGGIVTQDPNGMEVNYLMARHFYEKTVNLDANNTQGLLSLIISSSIRNKPIEKIWLNELNHRLGYSIFAANIGNKLTSLVSCQEQGVCKLTNSEIEGLFQAALRNPSLTERNRAEILSAFSIYLVNVKHDYPTALTAMHQMVESQPKVIEYRFTLLQYLIALQRFDEAKEQLTILKKLDILKIRVADIEMLSKKLLSEQTNTELNP